MKTLENKICASLLISAGLVPTILVDDATALVFFAMFAVPMFFSKKSWFC